MIVVTGATGQLGRLVIEALLKTQSANEIIAAVRSPEKAGDLAALGVQVRRADYNEPATLDTAFKGADKLLLISSSELGRRAVQHRAAIDAAKRVVIHKPFQGKHPGHIGLRLFQAAKAWADRFPDIDFAGRFV